MEEKIFKGCYYIKSKDKYSDNQGYSLRLIYKGEEFNLDKILKLYNFSGDWEEILPNIFYRHIEVKKKFWEFWKNERFEWAVKILDNSKIWIEVYYEYTIDNADNPKLEWSSDKAIKVREKERKYKRQWNVKNYKCIGEDFEFVPIEKITGFPNALGKGVSGCIQLNNYRKRGLYLNNDEWNGEMILAEVLEASAKNLQMVKECTKSNRCGWLYKRYVDGTLDKMDDYVIINKVDENYHIGSNGNHRICLLKRINAKFIYAKVYRWVKK